MKPGDRVRASRRFLEALTLRGQDIRQAGTVVRPHRDPETWVVRWDRRKTEEVVWQGYLEREEDTGR